MNCQRFSFLEKENVLLQPSKAKTHKLGITFHFKSLVFMEQSIALSCVKRCFSWSIPMLHSWYQNAF